jgi:restriction endonuclease S subunit
MDTRFIRFWLAGVARSLLGQLVEDAAHGTKAIRMDRWRLLPVQVPPLEEQRAIVALLDRETTKIDALIARIRTAIDRLKGYRIALISAAVTGKIDVRGEVGARIGTV